MELRLMSDPAFSEEFDVVVEEIATLYVKRQLSHDEKTRVEQYFLRSPERRKKVQFICELLRQIDQQPVPEPAVLNNASPGLWQRVSSFGVGSRSAMRPAISLAVLLIVGALVFWVISQNSNPTFQSFALAMTNALRDTGTQTKRIRLESGIDELRINLALPTPAAPQYRASLRGEKVSLSQLAIEAQDAESITVRVPADQISRGIYVIELKEVTKDGEKPLRGAYVFAVD